MAQIKRKNIRHGEQGATIIESMLSIMVLMLILFGLLQLFHVALAREVSMFAAFRGARSAAVGFCDYLVHREAKVHSIPAAGPMTEYRNSSEFSSAYEQFSYEQTMIPRFMNGNQWLNYEYWGSTQTLYHADYKCPSYGLRKGRGDSGLDCACSDCCGDKPSTVIDCNRLGEKVSVYFEFRQYPFRMPMYDAFESGKHIDIKAETEMTNHSDSYLD